jgi:hypothetical protein
MMKSRLLVFLVAIIEMMVMVSLMQPVAGCVQNTALEPPQPSGTVIHTRLDSAIQLRINQAATIDSENLQIQFLSVSEDSRCPSDVTCIQQGQVTVVLNLAQRDRNLRDSLTLTKRAAQENLARKDFAGYVVQLLDVSPYPTTTQKLKPEVYRITLLVSKA